MPTANQLPILAPIPHQGFNVLNSDRQLVAWFGNRLDAVIFCLSKSFNSPGKFLLTDAATAKFFGTYYLGERISNQPFVLNGRTE